jgi:EAL domain-containing protein (putative c-di-GMP-specific phosphodiesterase class I)
MLLDPEISAIVAAVINLANSLRIDTVAEGIEIEEQAEVLRAAGCTLGQGYLLGLPQEAAVVGTHCVARQRA